MSHKTENYTTTVKFQYSTIYRIALTSGMTGITTVANTHLVERIDASKTTDGTLPNYSGALLFGITYYTSNFQQISFVANGTISADGSFSCTWTQALPVGVNPAGSIAIYGPITVRMTSITSDSGDINWANADNSTQLQLVIASSTDSSGINTPLGTTINLTPSATGIYNLNSLNPSTTYIVYFINEWGNATGIYKAFSFVTADYSPPPPPPQAQGGGSSGVYNTEDDDTTLCKFWLILSIILFCLFVKTHDIIPLCIAIILLILYRDRCLGN